MSKAGAVSPKWGKKNSNGMMAVVSQSSGSAYPLVIHNQVHSRYLSDSMSSCHDLCKYGKKNSNGDGEGSSSTMIKSFIAEKRKIMKKKKKNPPNIESFDGNAGNCILAKNVNADHVPPAAAAKKTTKVKVVKRNIPPTPPSSARLKTRASSAAKSSSSLSSGKLKSKLASGFKSIFVPDPPKNKSRNSSSAFSRTPTLRRQSEIESSLKGKCEVREKTIYITEDKNADSELSEVLPSLPKLAFEAGEEGLEELESSYSEDDNEGDVKNKYKMVGGSSDEEEPHKLKFRRGDAVEINSGNDDGPRKLKFKQGRVIDDNDQNGEDASSRIMFKKKVDVGSGGSNLEANEETVTLRHEDGPESNKKDAQGLLNDVIELTATKLAESRNSSKVKALVGAFETVISLQDTKPAPSSLV